MKADYTIYTSKENTLVSQLSKIENVDMCFICDWQTIERKEEYITIFNSKKNICVKYTNEILKNNYKDLLINSLRGVGVSEAEAEYAVKGNYDNKKSFACHMVLALMDTERFSGNYCKSLDLVLILMPYKNKEELEKELNFYI